MKFSALMGQLHAWFVRERHTLTVILELMSHKSPCFLQTLDHFLALLLDVFCNNS